MYILAMIVVYVQPTHICVTLSNFFSIYAMGQNANILFWLHISEQKNQKNFVFFVEQKKIHYLSIEKLLVRSLF